MEQVFCESCSSWVSIEDFELDRDTYYCPICRAVQPAHVEAEIEEMYSEFSEDYNAINRY